MRDDGFYFDYMFFAIFYVVILLILFLLVNVFCLIDRSSIIYLMGVIIAVICGSIFLNQIFKIFFYKDYSNNSSKKETIYHFLIITKMYYMFIISMLILNFHAFTYDRFSTLLFSLAIFGIFDLSVIIYMRFRV